MNNKLNTKVKAIIKLDSIPTMVEGNITAINGDRYDLMLYEPIIIDGQNCSIISVHKNEIK